jgi:hypothetical protein
MSTQNVPVARRPQTDRREPRGARPYAITGATRVIYGQRIEGVVRVVDVPVDDYGRAYLVERELEQDGHTALNALVADYVAYVRARSDTDGDHRASWSYSRNDAIAGT